MNELRSLWQLRGIGFGSTKPIFCDLDNDSAVEIIVNNLSGDLIVVSGDDGEIKRRSNLAHHAIRDIIASDINNDGSLEILLATASPNIMFLDSSLNAILYNVLLPSLPLKIYLADIDNDHLSEVIVVDVTSSVNIIKSNRIISRFTLSKPIYALSYGKIRMHGDVLDGLLIVHDNRVSVYRKEERLELLSEKTLPLDVLKARIVDINNDGVDEVIIADRSNIFIMYDVNERSTFSFQLFSDNFVNFNIGDLDKDGKKEIIAIGRRGMGNRWLKILTLDAELAFEYPLPFDGSKILIGDVNGDGSSEIILSDVLGKELFCLDIKNSEWCRWISRDNFLFIDLYDVNCDLRDEVILRTIDKLIVLTYYDS